MPFFVRAVLFIYIIQKEMPSIGRLICVHYSAGTTSVSTSAADPTRASSSLYA